MTSLSFPPLISEPAEAQVLPWPGEKLMDLGLSYQSAVKDARSLRLPWVVFAARDKIWSFSDSACIQPLHQLSLFQSFYVSDIDYDAGSLHLVYADVRWHDPFRQAEILKDWGWAKMDDLLLSNRAFRDPLNFVPPRVLIRNEMTRSGVADIPKLYAAPQDGARVLKELDNTIFSYLYKVWPGDEKFLNGRYDPLWGYDWYLIASEPVLHARPGSHLPPIGKRGYIGWLKGRHALLWITREALEPALGRKLTASVFSDLRSALDYAHEPNRLDQALRLDTTPNKRTWMGQRLRYPVLGQESERRGQAASRLIAYPSQEQVDNAQHAAASGRLRSQIQRLRGAAEKLKAIFIFDGAVRRCDYITYTAEAIQQVWKRIDRNLDLEIGAVVFKDRADGSQVTQLLELTPNVELLLRRLQRVSCDQFTHEGDSVNGPLKGLHDAWSKILDREDNSYVTYILLGDTASPHGTHQHTGDLASQISGLTAPGTGDWNLFSFHGFHLRYGSKSFAEVQAIQMFQEEIEVRLIGRLNRLEAPLRFPGSGSPHTFQVVRADSPTALRAAARDAAAKIELSIYRRKLIVERADRMLATGEPLQPVAMTMTEQFLRSRLNRDLTLPPRKTPRQVFSPGYVLTSDAQGRDVMSPVLFLDPRETSELLDMAENIREFKDCDSLKQYFTDLIGTITPEDERLPISILIERRRGVRFQSELLQIRYSEIDGLCSTSSAREFDRLLRRFEELDQFIFAMINEDTVDSIDSRKYELSSGDFYWIPMDKLP